MILHWADVSPFDFIRSYLGHDLEFERMSYPRGYVSYFRICGVPILPPLVSVKHFFKNHLQINI